jgi:DDE superfamily endonuclease
LQQLLAQGKRLRYLCQDETRLALKTIAGRLLTACKVKPCGSSQWQREAFYLYGVVEPLSGFSFYYEFSHLDSLCLQHFLDLLSSKLGDDMALLQLERCAAHRAGTLQWPENIIPVFQPAHSPELNPIEQVWQALKRQLCWQNCHFLDELRERVAAALDALTPEHIISLSSYNFILEALFSAAL